MYTRNAWEKSLPHNRLRGGAPCCWGESTKIKQPLFVLSGQGESQGNQYFWVSFISFVKKYLRKGGERTYPDGLFFNLSISRRAWEPWMSTPNRLLRPATKPQKATFFLPGPYISPNGCRDREQRGEWEDGQQRHSNRPGRVRWWHPGAGHGPLSR